MSSYPTGGAPRSEDSLIIQCNRAGCRETKSRSTSGLKVVHLALCDAEGRFDSAAARRGAQLPEYSAKSETPSPLFRQSPVDPEFPN